MRLEKNRQDQMTPAERITSAGEDWGKNLIPSESSSDHNPIYGRIKMLFKRHQYPGLLV